MRNITLGLREIVANSPIKKVCISKKITRHTKPKLYYQFSSAFDQCNYLYPIECGLEVAIESYERDTKWMLGFKFIEYYTYDEEIELEWKQNVPF